MESGVARGLRQHMQVQADVLAIQAWLGGLDPIGGPGQSGSVVCQSVTEPERLPAIARLNPKGIAVSIGEAGRSMVRLTCGSGIVGSWGLVVREGRATADGNAAQFTGDSVANNAEECVLPLAGGAYVWYDPD